VAASINRVARDGIHSEFLGDLGQFDGEIRRLPHLLGSVQDFINSQQSPKNLWPDGLPDQLQESNDRLAALAITIDVAERAIAIVVSEAKPPKQERLEPEIFIAKTVGRAWRLTIGREPKSKNPGDPLTLFVTTALAEIGYAQSAATVSDRLRRRDRRTRKGRAPGAPPDAR
jgi:hypothetical protein